jgi:ribosomal protein S24E
MASDLKDLKGSGIEPVTIKYKNRAGASSSEHKVGWSKLRAPWQGYLDKKNRLESSWNRFNRILASDEQPFEIKKISVNSGTGEVKVDWHVWDDAKKLSNSQVEHYAVMRAEDRYISRGYRKVASKYFCFIRRKVGGKMIAMPSENSGIDSFFANGDKFVVCESKFTRDEGLASRCHASDAVAWGRLDNYKGVRQMSWKWIGGRAKRAARNPAGVRKADAATKKAIKKETNAMLDAVEDREGVERVLNVFGSSRLPVFPGIYVFRSATGHKTTNKLDLKWTLDLADAEFILLGAAFDKWCGEADAEES